MSIKARIEKLERVQVTDTSKQLMLLIVDGKEPTEEQLEAFKKTLDYRKFSWYCVLFDGENFIAEGGYHSMSLEVKLHNIEAARMLFELATEKEPVAEGVTE